MALTRRLNLVKASALLVGFLGGSLLTIKVAAQSTSTGSAPVGPGTEVWISGDCSGGSGEIATPEAVADDTTWLGQTLAQVFTQIGSALYQGQADIAQAINQIEQQVTSTNSGVATGLATAQQYFHDANTYYAPMTGSAACNTANGVPALSNSSTQLAQVNQAVAPRLASLASAPVSARMAAEPLPAAFTAAAPVAKSAAIYNLGGSTKSATDADNNLNAEYKTKPGSFDAEALMHPDRLSGGSDPETAADSGERYIYHVTNPMPPAGFTAPPADMKGAAVSAAIETKTAKMSLAQESMRHVLDMTVPNPALGTWTQQVVQQLCGSGGISGTMCSEDFSAGASLNQFYDVVVNEARLKNLAWYTELYSEPEAALQREIAMQLAIQNGIAYERMLLDERRANLEAASYAQQVDSAHGAIEGAFGNGPASTP